MKPGSLFRCECGDCKEVLFLYLSYNEETRLHHYYSFKDMRSYGSEILPISFIEVEEPT